LVENSGFGGKNAAPIASKLVQFFFNRGADDLHADTLNLLPQALMQNPNDVEESSLLPDSVN